MSLPRNLTWNLQMMVSKRNHLFQGLRTSGSMLNFRGVCLDVYVIVIVVIQYTRHVHIPAMLPSQPLFVNMY